MLFEREVVPRVNTSQSAHNGNASETTFAVGLGSIYNATGNRTTGERKARVENIVPPKN